MRFAWEFADDMNVCFLGRWQWAAPVVVGCLLGGAADAPAQTLAQLMLANAGTKATVQECVEVIKGDSTLLYYDLRYNLTPPACADIRRHAHITDKGDFQGEVRDYTMATNALRSRLHYEQGQRHGAYETYFPNGQLAVRGSFARGEPTGTWEFWYESGKPWQTFEWTGRAAPRLRIVAYWDSTGQAGVSGGNGLWQGQQRQLKRRYGGPVLNGLPQGVWESHAVDTHKLMTTETYEQGIFRGGKALDTPPGMPARYKDHSLLEPQIDDPTEPGDQVRLGLNCASVQAAQERLSQQRQARQAYGKMRLEPPKPPGDAISYMQRLLDRLQQTNLRNQWENMADGQEFMVRATVDPEGTLRLVSGQGGSGIVAAVGQALDGTRRWHPGTADGQPVAGEVLFLIVKRGAQLNIRWKAGLSMLPGAKPAPTGPG